MLSIGKTNSIKSTIKQAFHFAYYSCDNSIEINQRMQDIKNKYPKSITVYEKFYFKGIIDTLMEQFKENNLEFCYEIDGEIYSTHKDSNKPRITDYSKINSDTTNGFYYKHNKTPFFN
jgi:hypothetical protein